MKASIWRHEVELELDGLFQRGALLGAVGVPEHQRAAGLVGVGSAARKEGGGR